MPIPERIYKTSGSPTAGYYGWPTVKTITGTNPAANTECDDAVPAGKCWLLRSYTLTCAQGITQTPLTSLTIENAAGTVVYSYPGTSSAQNVSTTLTMRWSPNQTLTAGGAATSATAPIPEGLLMPEGYSCVTSTNGKGAATDHGAPIIEVYEYTLTG